MDFSFIVAIILAYLIGSIPTAVWIGKKYYGVDVRDYESGNAGATNTFRVLGKKAGIVVLIIDILKGFIAVYLTQLVAQSLGSDRINIVKIVAGASAVLGHVFPLFAEFRGGKGVATVLGAVIGINPLASLVAVLIFIVVLIATKYVSLGSLIGGISFPLTVFFIQHNNEEIFTLSMQIFSIAVVVMLFYTHRTNIKRLLLGKENKTYITKSTNIINMDNKNLKKSGFATKAIHGGKKPNQFGALADPIYQTSTFVFDNVEQGGRRFALEEEGYIYTRLGNPSCTTVEEKIALLEGAEACVSAASGIGAITSAIWVCVQAGDHIVASKTLYGCTFAFLSHGITRYGVEVTFVDTRDIENVKKAMKPNTKLVYIETPANPNMYITDIKALAEIVHKQKDCKLMVDNTFATPFITRPLELGADVVVHSATKYLNGHGDVIAGFVVGKKEYIDNVKLFGIKDLTGATLSPFDAYLINRGLKTLEIRVQRHSENAMKVAEFLESHKAVETVVYPGLKSFPQYEVAKKQMSLPGGIISFEVKGGIEAGKKLLNNLSMIAISVSLGDADTLIQHPASMTHSTYTAEERAASDISDGLIRISVGLENVEDIISDLKQSLDKL